MTGESNMLDELLLYLKGYLILELYDGQRERFINLCKNKEIEIIHIFISLETFPELFSTSCIFTLLKQSDVL